MMNGAEVLVASLADLGVKVVFGIPGGAIVPVYEELRKRGITPVINANEQSAGFAAAGYSRSGHGVGVAIVTSGPATTNVLTSVADAYFDSKPMLVFTGQVAEHKIGTDAFQHIDVEGVFGPAAKKVTLLTNGDLERIIKDSYYLAISGKPGPLVIDFPVDRQNKSMSYDGLDSAQFVAKYRNNTQLSSSQCEHFFSLLQQSKKPMLYIGGGTNTPEASRLVREFNSRFNLPYVHTLMGKGVLDDRSELCLGMLGMFGTPYANKAILETDLFIALGARWDDRVAEKVGLFGPQAKVAYIDINPEKVQQIRGERNAEFTFVGDVSNALRDLNAYPAQALDINCWRQEALDLKRRWRLEYNRSSDRIQAAGVMELLNNYLDDAIVTTGVGNHQMLAAQYIQSSRPQSFLTSGSFGTMGFALPTAVGASLANPEKLVVVIDGDGSFSMNEGELRTVMEYKLPIKIVIINNSGFGMVRNLQDVLYPRGNYSGTLRGYDTHIAAIAKAHGFGFSERVQDKGSLLAAIGGLMQYEGAALLEIMTDPDEVLYPKVPPGKLYHDMVLGPYMHDQD